MSKKYIKCDNCGKKIYFGEEIVSDREYYDIYCSAECYAVGTADFDTLTEEYAEECGHTIYNDEERKAIIKAQIEKLQDELAKLEKE